MTATRLPSATSDWHRVGAGFSVRFATGPSAGVEACVTRLDVEWSPRLPTRRELRRVADRYRGARSHFIADLAARLGGCIVCVEVPR